MNNDTTTIDSVLTKNQVKVFRKEFKQNGKPAVIIAKVRYDDQCGNGHNTFAITGELYDSPARATDEWINTSDGKHRVGISSGGCIHEEIAKHFPELAPFIKWHLCSSDEPMHYIANTVYHANNRDCWGLLEGEARQIRNGKTGELCWKLAAIDEIGSVHDISDLEKYPHGETAPECPYTLAYVPWCRIGKGKPRDLDAARSCAIWPDATDEELTAPGLKERLEARRPALMSEFRAAVESLGFTY